MGKIGLASAVSDRAGNASAGAPQKHLSLAARRKVAAAQRARWAKVRAQQKKAA